MSHDELLTLSEVALRLRVSRRTVERLVASGRIRTVRPSPGRTCVTGREIAAFSGSVSVLVEWTLPGEDGCEPNRLTHARRVLLHQRPTGVVVGG